MSRVIVSDATPIIAFSRINELKLLQEIVKEIIIPYEVSKELFEYAKEDTKILKKCDWIQTKTVREKKEVELLLPSLDKGEAEVLVLSKQLKADLVVIDELSARKIALMMGLPLIGTVGLLIYAKESKLINKVKPLLDQMMTKDIRFGGTFYRKILKELGELK